MIPDIFEATRMKRPGNLHNRYFMLAALAMVAIQMVAASFYDIFPAESPRDNFAAIATRPAPEAVAPPAAVAPPEVITPPEVVTPPVVVAPPEAVAPSARTESPEIVAPIPLPEHNARGVVTIDRVFLDQVPDFRGKSLREKRRQFIAFVLPMILEANSEIEERRDAITRAARRGNMNELAHWADRYDYAIQSSNPETIKNALLERVAPVPVSIAIAQAAIESGWGTSRFAREGNALFGQRTTSRQHGIVAGGDDSVFVRKFDTPLQSVKSYMHNLNVHDFYAEFRSRRARMDSAASPTARNIRTLAESLGNYSIEREEYVQKLLSVIRVNDLRHYERAIFAEK